MNKLFKPGGHDMRNFTIVLLLLWLIYIALVFLAPAADSSTRYGLTVAQTNLLRFTIILPLLFIWLTALFSVVRFRQYYALVKDSPESKAFHKITAGLFMLLLVIVLPSLVNAVANFWPNSETAQQISTIGRNYITLILYLTGFWYLWQASRDFYHTVSEGLPANWLRLSVLISVLILVVLYTWSVFHNPFRTVSHDPLVRPTYYLSDAWITLTIILPYAMIWLLGGLTIINLLSYVKKVPGIIYRQTFSSVAYGLIVTIALLIGLQFLSQANAVMGHATIKLILVIIYLLLFAIAAGYFLVARGARKLTAIEEVK